MVKMLGKYILKGVVYVKNNRKLRINPDKFLELNIDEMIEVLRLGVKMDYKQEDELIREILKRYWIKNNCNKCKFVVERKDYPKSNKHCFKVQFPVSGYKFRECKRNYTLLKILNHIKEIK